jgi:hypothetical protein
LDLFTEKIRVICVKWIRKSASEVIDLLSDGYDGKEQRAQRELKASWVVVKAWPMPWTTRTRSLTSSAGGSPLFPFAYRSKEAR